MHREAERKRYIGVLKRIKLVIALIMSLHEAAVRSMATEETFSDVETVESHFNELIDKINKHQHTTNTRRSVKKLIRHCREFSMTADVLCFNDSIFFAYEEP